MIAINDKEINLSLDSNGNLVDSRAKEVLDGIERIEKEYGFPLRIKFPKDKKFESIQEKNGQVYKMAEYPAGVAIPTSFSIPDPVSRMPLKWQYYTSSRVDSRDKIVYYPSAIDFNGQLVIDRDNADLAFFLLFKCPLCQGSLGIPEGQLKRTYFVVENRKKESEERVGNILRDEKFKIHLLEVADIEDINRCLFSIGKGEITKELSDIERREVLVNWIYEDNTEKTKATRLNRVERILGSDKEREIFALIKEAKEAGILYCDKKRWSIVTGKSENGEDETETLCWKASRFSIEDTLINYLIKNKKVVEQIKRLLSER
jgi:hypothetical protein